MTLANSPSVTSSAPTAPLSNPVGRQVSTPSVTPAAPTAPPSHPPGRHISIPCVTSAALPTSQGDGVLVVTVGAGTKDAVTTKVVDTALSKTVRNVIHI